MPKYFTSRKDVLRSSQQLAIDSHIVCEVEEARRVDIVGYVPRFVFVIINLPPTGIAQLGDSYGYPTTLMLCGRFVVFGAFFQRAATAWRLRDDGRHINFLCLESTYNNILA